MPEVMVVAEIVTVVLNGAAAKITAVTASAVMTTATTKSVGVPNALL